jgi:MFS superfamily sulfate permease-like transporter
LHFDKRNVCVRTILEWIGQLGKTMCTGILIFAAGLLKPGFVASFFSRPTMPGYLNVEAILFSNHKSMTGE